MKKTASIRRDKANKALVRSYFDAAPRAMAKKAARRTGARGRAVAAEAAATAPERADAFVEENRSAFHLEKIELRRDLVKEGAASASVRYEQRHQGVPVYGAQLVVGLPKDGGDPTSAMNKVDYDLKPDPRLFRAAIDKIQPGLPCDRVVFVTENPSHVRAAHLAEVVKMVLATILVAGT